MKLKAIGNRVIVQQDTEKKEFSGDIYIPEAQQEMDTVGRVVAVGCGNWSKSAGWTPLDVACGDRVLFGIFSGTPISVMGIKYLVMTEHDILATLS